MSKVMFVWAVVNTRCLSCEYHAESRRVTVICAFSNPFPAESPQQSVLDGNAKQATNG